MPFDLSRLDLLVVEPDETMLATWRRVFGGLGIRATRVAPNAARAWSELCRTAPDVLIARWDLPGATAGGLALVQKLRRDPASPLPFLPAIIVTAKITRDHIRAALDAGVNEIMVLPLSPKAVETRLRETIERPRKFVRGEDYFGPDRRRHVRHDFAGPFRRADDRPGNGIKPA